MLTATVGITRKVGPEGEGLADYSISVQADVSIGPDDVYRVRDLEVTDGDGVVSEVDDLSEHERQAAESALVERYIAYLEAP